MGNHGSHAAASSRAQLSPQLHQQQWAHSFPRDLQRVPHLKVLPEGGIGQRLRSTDNGAILNAEGTIRGRRHGSFRRDGDEFPGNNGVYRSSSVHRTQYPENGQLHRSRTQMYRDRDGNAFTVQAKRFGSEPDLRQPTHNNTGADGFGVGAKNRISRGRKKYKAPAPPPVIVGDGSSPDSYHWELTSGGDTSDSAAPQRRLRLFKTRAETHKHGQAHQRLSTEIREERREIPHIPLQPHRPPNGHRPAEPVLESRELREHRPDNRPREIEPPERRDRFTRSSERYEDRGEGGVMIRGREREVEVRQTAKHQRNSAPPVMHRSLSSPEFQAELRAVTQRLRVMDKTKFDRREKPVEETDNNSRVHVQKIERERNNRNDEIRRKTETTQNNKMITMDHHNIPAKQRLINGFKESVEKKHTKKDMLEARKELRQPKYSRESSQDSQVTDGDMSRGQASGKESTPEQSPTRINEQRKTTDDFKAPAKTFYFGMETSEQNQTTEITKTKTVLEKIPIEKIKPTNIENIMAYKIPRQSSSESALSSEPDFDDNQQNGHDISMQLRPTLPKKQLDIPRFSPATAWRLLSVVDHTNHPGNSIHESEEGPVLMEERIERLSRPQPSIPLLGQRSSHDKSGDSGISGDAGPALMEEFPEPPPPPLPHPKIPSSSGRPTLVAWTPQQDLEEEASSSDGGLESPKTSTPTDVKFNARSHVFSLSLPRESHLTQYAGSDKSRPAQGFNSLQKLRRSLGAALGSRSRNSDDPPPEVDANWFLSTSAPNSLNHSSAIFRLSRTHSDEEERHTLLDKEPTMMKSPSFTYLANGGHVMYLPSFEKEPQKNIATDDTVLRNKDRYSDTRYREDRISKVKSIEIPCRKEFGRGLRKLPLSKSCENISSEMRQINRTPSPDSKQSHKSSKVDENERKIIKGKGKRFTFQSTVRQIERRRIAEKLSKEAERKEKQRLGELEAMRRVEEEFQRKRAREKASIRQQLRLYSLDESNQNGPTNWDSYQLRPEPDGAVSSPAPSPTNHNSKTFTKSKDNRTPYVNKIVEQRMSKAEKNDSPVENSTRNGNVRLETYDQRDSPDISKRLSKHDHRSSPTTRSSDDGRIKTAATEILSEYRQATREYRDYRGFSRFAMDGANEQQTTVHPQVVYNMPKASHGHSYHEVCVAEGSVSPRSDNYRRDFAHGALPTSSDSELSQPNTRPHSPRHLPRLRARSASPDCARAEYRTESVHTKEPADRDVILDEEPSTRSEVEEVAAAPLVVDIIPLPKVSLSTLHLQPFVPGKSFKPVTFNVK